jgi:pheromone shutdown protein TraB
VRGVFNLGGAVPAVLRSEDSALVQSHGRDFHILGTVTGLVSEAHRVAAVFQDLAPDCLAVGIPANELTGLRTFMVDGPDAQEPEEEDVEEGYSVALSRFGDVGVPPPDLMEAVRLAVDGGLDVFPLDLDDETYADAFTQEVSGIQLIRYSLKLRRLARKPPKATSAGEFALKWDGDVRRLKGFARLELRRERKMAESLRAIPADYTRILAVIELPRLAGVSTILRTL